MDGITKLRGVSNWAYVQRNQFPGQSDDADKVFVFKMSEVGPGSGVELVQRRTILLCVATLSKSERLGPSSEEYSLCPSTSFSA
jgi:hypothetical protein